MLKRMLRNNIPNGVLDALRNLRSEINYARLHRTGTKKARTLSGSRGLKLHFGCGSNPKPGWVNIDLAAAADITLDLRRPIPLPDECASLLYSEHFLEHLDYPNDARRFISEAFRILEPGGRFSVGVPDTEILLHAYCELPSAYNFDTAKKIWHPSWCETPMEHANYHFRQGTEHRFAWDFLTLEKCLIATGFASVERRPFDATLDLPSRELGTLYVDAKKPSRHLLQPATQPELSHDRNAPAS